MHLPPHNLSQRLHLLEDVEILGPGFRRYSHSYLIKVGLAAAAMLALVKFLLRSRLRDLV